MAGVKDPTHRAPNRVQSQPLGANRAPNVESEKTVVKAEIPLSSIEHGSPAIEKDTTAPIKDTLGTRGGGADTANSTQSTKPRTGRNCTATCPHFRTA